MPLAIKGDDPDAVAFCHLVTSDGLPLASCESINAERPLSWLTTYSHTFALASVQVAIASCISPPVGKGIEKSSPPTCAGPPAPLRLSRLTMRSVESLLACTAKCGYLLV